MAQLNSRAADGWKDEYGRLRVTINGRAVLMESPPTNGHGSTVEPLDAEALAW